MPQELSLLLVGDRCTDIEGFLNHTCWRVWRARTVSEATAILKREPVQVVLCQYMLQDGTWLDVLNTAENCDPAPAVVVLSCADARLWAEVLSRGAYDVLPVPCTAAELYTLVPMAWRHCRQQQYRQMARGAENRA